MPNTKISALTSATTPLAGTETLPIVQSSTTKQVSVANLTAGRAVSFASCTWNTTGYGDGSYLGIANTNPSAYGNRLVVGSYSETSATLNGAYFATSRAILQMWADGATNANGAFISVGWANGGQGPLNLQIGSTTTLQLKASGDIGVQTGNLVIGTSGKGITNSTGAVKLNFNSDRTSLSGAQSVYTGDFYNVGTTQTITISDTHGGYIVITSVQGGVGSSTWTLPFVKRGGSISIGVASKAILTADPIVSVATSGGNITVTPLAANTYLTYAIYYTPLAL